MLWGLQWRYLIYEMKGHLCVHVFIHLHSILLHSYEMALYYIYACTWCKFLTRKKEKLSSALGLLAWVMPRRMQKLSTSRAIHMYGPYENLIGTVYEHLALCKCLTAIYDGLIRSLSMCYRKCLLVMFSII